MTLKLVFILIAIACGFVALVGWPEGADALKLVAAAVVALAIAVVVP